MSATIEFDARLLQVHINAASVTDTVHRLKQTLAAYDQQSKIEDLLFAIECIDLTTLAGDDTPGNVTRLCWRATNPLCGQVIDQLKQSVYYRPDSDVVFNVDQLTTAAVCVYPARVVDCHRALGTDGNVAIASVVAGFPAGQGPLASTLAEIEFAAKNGATEIDIVINRTLALCGRWRELYEEIVASVDKCHECGVHLKVILGCGELATLDNIYKASMCAMMAGADFIKTSTGKEAINATLSFGVIMARAIRDFHHHTQGRLVGLKPAGGLKTATDALLWINLVRYHLGRPFLTKQLFRLGASSLLNNILFELYTLLFGHKPTEKLSY